MATIIAVYSRHGCIGKCDQYCYDDVDAACACVCHGTNHGVGFDQAVKNTALRMAYWAHADHYPPETSRPKAVLINPAVKALQVTLDIEPHPFQHDPRRPL